MTEMIKTHEMNIESFTLIPSDGGTFEFSVNGKLIYSKLQTGRHANDGEVASLVGEYLREGV